MVKFVLLAESGADIPPELIMQHQFKVVPMHVSLGDNTKDDMSFPTEELFEFYDKTGILPKTSGCNPDDFEKVFDEVHRQFPDCHIIHLAYSASTTCSYQSALIAAEDRSYVSLHEQSPDIAMGVDNALESRENGGNELGAGDQGMMFGYACDETDELMPLPISLAHALTMRLSEVRKTGLLPYLRPDGKSQVTVEYDGNEPVRVHTVVISAQHDPDMDMKKFRQDIISEVFRAAIPEELMDDNTIIYVNPTGRFVLGGPAADSGLTGRKIIVDTYGGYARHGGGAFSGKDPTKVDRSASYMARYIAKNVVAAGMARRCEIKLSYAIGIAQPVSVMVDTFGTGTVSDEVIAQIILCTVALTPSEIIDALGLRSPLFRTTSAYGHFGLHCKELPWEQCDIAWKLGSALTLCRTAI